MKEEKEARCSFCGIAQSKSYKLIAGPGVYICDECTRTAYNLIFSVGETPKPVSRKKAKLMTPQEIKVKLDEYIVSQDQAKKKLAVAVYNHYKRIHHSENLTQVDIKKSNGLDHQKVAAAVGPAASAPARSAPPPDSPRRD